MAKVITRPTETAAVVAPGGGRDRPMGVEVCNALVTGAPLRDGELLAMIGHFRALHELLVVSGPRFSAAGRDAVDLHNRSVRRLRETREEAARRQAQRDVPPELMEIET